MAFLIPVITIDGPSSAGKGTLCKALAEKLQWNMLDSGAIYRVLALSTLYHQVTIENEDVLVRLASQLDANFQIKKGKMYVFLKGKDVSEEIRNESIGNLASKIAVLPKVREVLLLCQRTFRSMPGLIADGRDMGTVVFPDAPVKIFLDASLEERTKRRMLQLRKTSFNVHFERILSEIQERDVRDRNRMIAPLVPTYDALMLNSTNLTSDTVIAKSLEYAKRVLSLA